MKGGSLELLELSGNNPFCDAMLQVKNWTLGRLACPVVSQKLAIPATQPYVPPNMLPPDVRCELRKGSGTPKTRSLRWASPATTFSPRSRWRFARAGDLRSRLRPPPRFPGPWHFKMASVHLVHSHAMGRLENQTKHAKSCNLVSYTVLGHILRLLTANAMGQTPQMVDEKRGGDCLVVGGNA